MNSSSYAGGSLSAEAHSLHIFSNSFYLKINEGTFNFGLVVSAENAVLRI